jgi:hypothetical protein
VFSPSILFFSSIRKEKKTQRKKIIKKKKYVEKGKILPSSSRSALSLLAPALAVSLLHFYSKCFVLESSSFQEEKKKNTTEKNHRKEKKCREEKEFTFKFSLCPFILGSCFCLLAFAL